MQRDYLTQDRRGAVMVMALFYGIFLVAIVFHVSAVGGAALEQEVTQNAADATVFSAATANARGMNTIAFINRFMAFAVSVLIGVKLLEVVMYVVVGLCTVLCAIPWTAGAGCSALATAEPVLAEVQQIADQVETVVTRVNKGLTKANEKGIKQVVPYLAEAEAIYISTRPIYDPVTAGFVWPLVDGLPVKPGEFKDLCREGAKNVADVVGYFAVGIPDAIVDRAVGGLVTSFSSYFCGDGGAGAGPPSETRTEEVAYPTYLDEDERCRGETGGRCPGDAAAQCNSESNWPQRYSGRCSENNSGCKSCAARACSKCLPLLDSDDYRQGSWHVVAESLISAETVDGRFLTTDIQNEEFLEGERGGNPCEGDPGGARANCAGYDGEWDHLSPICTVEQSRTAVSLAQWERIEAQYGVELVAAERVKRWHYTALLSCVVEKDMVLTADGDPLTESESSDEIYPMVVDDGRYPADAQMKGVVAGGSAGGSRLLAVGIAADSEAGSLPGRLGFASAFYYSTEEDPARALWSMRWTTRLIRFRLGDASENPGGGALSFGDCDDRFFAECSGASGALNGLQDAGRGLELILH